MKINPAPIKNTVSCFLLAIMAFVNIACERDIDIELPILDPVLVLNGSMHHNPSAFVSETQPLLNFTASKSGDPLALNFTPEYFEDVQAELWANGNFVDEFDREPLPLQPDVWEYFIEDYEPEPGTNYEIRARKSGLDPVNVKVNMPNETPIISATWVNRENGVFRFSFQDAGNQRRFYLIKVFSFISEQEIPILFGSLDGDVQIQEFFSNPFETEVPTGLEAFMVNDNFRGQEKSVMIEIPLELAGSIDTTEINIELFTINEDTYRYHLTIQAYESTRGNPFSEPVNIHTNVTGGLGFVGGYVRSFKKVE